MRNVLLAGLFFLSAACASDRSHEQATTSAPPPSVESSEFQVVPLKFASAPEVADELRELLSQADRAQRARTKSPLPSITVIADARTNSLLVGVPPERRGELPRVLELLAKLDVEVKK